MTKEQRAKQTADVVLVTVPMPVALHRKTKAAAAMSGVSLEAAVLGAVAEAYDGVKVYVDGTVKMPAAVKP